MTFGYRIVTATDPEEVFKLLLNTHIDAVITDKTTIRTVLEISMR